MRRFSSFLCAAALAVASVQPALSAEKVSVAWSHYTGWEAWGYIADKGIGQAAIERSCGKGSELKITLVNDYAESLNLYTSGTFQGVAATNMDSLAVPGVGGVKTDMLIVGDYSDGNDAIISGDPTVDTVAKLKGRQVNLVQLTVSHYLLARALDGAGVRERDMKIVNTSDADIAAFFSSQKNPIVVTWNPIVMAIQAAAPKANVLFTSAKIPGEIIDAMVVRADMPTCAKTALRDAWWTTIAKLKAGDKELIAFLANQAGGTVDEFNAQVKTTHFFWTPEEADAFVRSNALKETTDYVRRFSFDHGLYNGRGVNDVGISFPDGFVLGNRDNAVVRFVPQK